ncbi:hypothetical protein D3C73_1455900 [compost metagenome]
MVGISIHDQVGIVGHDDDLTSELSLAEPCDQLLKHRLRIQILFWLINDERPVIFRIDRQIQQQEHNPSRPWRKLLNFYPVVLKGVPN